MQEVLEEKAPTAPRKYLPLTTEIIISVYFYVKKFM